MRFIHLKILIIFLFSTIVAHAENSFYQEQIKPGLQRTIDADSIKILLGGTHLQI